jgi:hypothetical protein
VVEFPSECSSVWKRECFGAIFTCGMVHPTGLKAWRQQALPTRGQLFPRVLRKVSCSPPCLGAWVLGYPRSTAVTRLFLPNALAAHRGLRLHP